MNYYKIRIELKYFSLTIVIIRYRRQPHGEETLRLSLPAPELELGTPPRLCYPLVIFLTRRDNKDPHPDETVSVIWIIDPRNNINMKKSLYANGAMILFEQWRVWTPLKTSLKASVEKINEIKSNGGWMKDAFFFFLFFLFSLPINI